MPLLSRRGTGAGAGVCVGGDRRANRLAADLMSPPLLTWTAGFDIIYACQDYASESPTAFSPSPPRSASPARCGSAGRPICCAAVMLICSAHRSRSSGVLYFSGVGMAIGLLIIEQSLVEPDDLSKVNLSFFTINGIISVLLGTLGIVDLLR